MKENYYRFASFLGKDIYLDKNLSKIELDIFVKCWNDIISGEKIYKRNFIERLKFCIKYLLGI